MSPRAAGPSSPPWLPASVTWMVLVIALALTGGAWWHVGWDVERQRRVALEGQVSILTAAIRERLAMYETALRAAAVVAAASPPATSASWQRFATEITPTPRSAAVDYVPHAALTSMATDPERRAVLERARDTGSLAVSGRLQAAANADAGPAILMAEPVFAELPPAPTPAQRRAALLGFVTMRPRVRDLLVGLLPPREPGVLLAIRDGSPTSSDGLLHDEIGDAAAGADAMLEQAVPFDFGGRRWTLSFRPEPWFGEALEPGTAVGILAGGVLLSVLLFAAMRLQATAEARASAAAGAVTSKLRDRESRLQAILDSEPECVKTVSPDGLLLQMNPAGLRMLEAATAEEVIGRSVFDLVHPDDREAFRRLHEGALAGGEGHLRFRVVGRRGGLHWVETMSVPLRDGRNEITSVLSVTRDITEQKRSEDMLVRTTAVMEAIFRAVPDLFFLLGEDGTILEFRGGADDDLYVPPTEFVGRRFQDVLPATVAGTLADSFTTARTTRQPQVIEYALATPRGDQVFEARLLPIDGGHVVVVARNVTERVRAEGALRASEARYRQIVETAAEGIWILDAGDRTTFVNPRLAELLRCPAEEILARPLFDFMDPEWQEVARRQLARREVGIGYDLDFRFRRADGTELWAIVSARTIEGADGRYAGALAMITDITDRRRSEEAHREAQSLMSSIVEHSPNMMFVKDARDLRFVLFNRAGETLLGYSREEMIGKNDYDLFPDSADFFTAKDREVLASGRLVEIAEESIQTRKKGLRYLRTLKVPIVGDDGRPQYLLGIAEDITDRKALQGQLRQAQKMEAVGTLAGGIAHDFNNILTSILGFSELARADAAGNHRAQGSIDNVLEAGQRAKSLVEQLMAFSRQQEPERRPLDVGAAVSSALRLLRPALPSSVAIAADIASDLPVVLADATQIHQLVMNLATNGAQAMPARRGVLAVVLRAVEVTPELAAMHLGLAPGRHVRLVVRDDGEGMDAATLERIFEPFFTTKQVGHGTGLGLPVVHGIVKSHGGAIAVHSARGRGTTVEVYLPAYGGALADAPAKTAVVPRGHGERILFVDDEVQLAELGRSMLESLGYRVTSLTDPIEAATVFRAGPNRFDLVVTDLTMPALSGTQLAEEVWRVRPDIPILFDTGFAGSLAPEAACMPGLRGVLAKPFSVETLGLAVHHALHPH